MVVMGEVALPLEAVRDQIAASLDLVVQVTRVADGGRRIVAVAEVVDAGHRLPALDAGDAGEHRRCRLLAGPDGLVALPARHPRSTGVDGADPDWVEA
jgi:hypothetical protein